MEPEFRTAKALIVVFSVIDEGCAFTASLDRYLELCEPGQIVFARAIASSGSWERLRGRIVAEHGAQVECIMVAIDTERPRLGSARRPGRQVNDRLGFARISGTDGYMPRLVRSRQDALLQAKRTPSRGLGLDG